MLFLSRTDVEELLTMEACIGAVEESHRRLARGEALQPLRSVEDVPGQDALLVVMPGGLPPAADSAAVEQPTLPLESGAVEEGAAEGVATTGPPVGRGALAVKVISVFPGNRERGEESHLGLVVLLRADTGQPAAVMDAAALTGVRTAAASAVATRLLAREGSRTLSLLGSGVQARSHLESMKAVLPLKEVRVWSPTRAHAREFAEREGQRHGLPVEVASGAREAVEGADVVCTVTSATEPIVEGEWLAAGTHVNAVGACTPDARELDTVAVSQARVYVDSRQSALAEAGDLLIPLEQGAVGEDVIRGELGELLLGRIRGRRSPEEITLYESLGLAVQDVAAARLAYQHARANGRGKSLETEE